MLNVVKPSADIKSTSHTYIHVYIYCGDYGRCTYIFLLLEWGQCYHLNTCFGLLVVQWLRIIGILKASASASFTGCLGCFRSILELAGHGLALYLPQLLQYLPSYARC